MMNFLAWALFGLVAGAVAKMIMPGKDPGGWIITILLGVGGSFVGGYLGQMLGLGTGGNEFSIMNMLSAVGGAILLLVIYRFISKK